MFEKRLIERCDVPGCPERVRCLDVERPTHCALYRLYAKNPTIISGGMGKSPSAYAYNAIRRDDGTEFPNMSAAARDAGCTRGEFYESVSKNAGKAPNGRYYNFVW